MNVHEFQAKALLKRYGVAVPNGREVTSPADAAAACKDLGGRCVIKAQIHAGGRGKAGGVKLCKSPAEAEAAARDLLGKRLVTHQTGPGGREVKRLLAEALSDIAREFYLGMVIDRATGRPAMMASAEGGVEIEEVAARAPEKILREGIRSGEFRPDLDVKVVSYGLLGMLNWAYKWYDPKGRLNVQQVAEQFTSLALAGLAVDESLVTPAISRRSRLKSGQRLRSELTAR